MHPGIKLSVYLSRGESLREINGQCLIYSYRNEKSRSIYDGLRHRAEVTRTEENRAQLTGAGIDSDRVYMAEWLTDFLQIWINA